MEQDSDKAWSIVALGDAEPADRGDFYDALVEDEVKSNLSIFGGGDAKFYENPRLEVTIIGTDGFLIPAAKYPRPAKFSAKSVNIFLDRYYVHSVPGKLFELELAISSRHMFTGRGRERVSHTMDVKGVIGDYVNYLSEPVFQDLALKDMLTLDIAVTFVTDRATEKLLAVLRSPELKSGLKLDSTYNPAFATVATYARGLVETIASARKNRAITDAHIGLETEPGEISLPLIEGTYVLFQPLSTTDTILNDRPRFDVHQLRNTTQKRAFCRNHLFLRAQKN